jgi:hypothetical protein
MRTTTCILFAASLSLALPAVAAPIMVKAAPPVTATSQIYGDLALPGTPEAAELAARGYVREELFMSGTGDVWGYGADGKARIETHDVPYTTRLVVIRPASAAKFSGNVQLNPIHPAAGIGVWYSLRDYALDHGDAFVAVMIGGDVNTRSLPKDQPPVSQPLALKWFDPVRYAEIRWPDEDGIRWDVFAQATRAIRAGQVLGSLKAQRIYASGWSYTGSYLRTFINEGFHDRLRDKAGKPLIDGYLIGISSSSYSSGYVPINAHSENLPAEDRRRDNRVIDVPVIQMMSENEAITNREPQTPDSDAPRRTRLYEVPGLTHGSGGSTRADVTGQQRASRGAPAMPRPTACAYPNTDVDMSHYGQAALANLDRWVRTGQAPPRVPRMKVDASYRQVRDAQGNTLGGLRPAELQVPLATYAEPADPACAPRSGGLGSPVLQMKRLPLSAEVLARLYPGGASDYLAKFDAEVGREVVERLILPADAAREKTQARAAAAIAFKPLASN